MLIQATAIQRQWYLLECRAIRRVVCRAGLILDNDLLLFASFPYYVYCHTVYGTNHHTKHDLRGSQFGCSWQSCSALNYHARGQTQWITFAIRVSFNAEIIICL